MVTTELLIRDLSRDLAPVRPRRAPGVLALVWLVVALLAVAAATSFTGPWRPGVLAQLGAAPRFALEVALGLLSVSGLSVYLFRLAIPGRASRRGAVAVTAVFAMWLWVLLWNALAPPLAPSMLGKRPHCAVEVVLFALLPALCGAWLLLRRYPLRPVATLSGIVLASALLPALLMQLACMYDPVHGALFHWLPAVILSLSAGALLYGLRRRLWGFMDNRREIPDRFRSPPH
ncbi:NrsF family protein [Parahaliea mediterranea]|uniref:DUF1109 family protein n=1 Tax=Parahaliea mediterranea TaxID=651086 RepID=A0A939DDC1_9GAMM|nr:NrsF family protein [Parahaliea mediterranea]MBN7796160.1 DUF1109 family protein [Parahaliea mediterranea]